MAAHIHACVKRGTIVHDGKIVDRFSCTACSFFGTLAEAVRHAVFNQFRVS